MPAIRWCLEMCEPIGHHPAYARLLTHAAVRAVAGRPVREQATSMHFCSGRPGAVLYQATCTRRATAASLQNYAGARSTARVVARPVADGKKERVEARLKLRSRLLSPALWGQTGRAAGWLAGLWWFDLIPMHATQILPSPVQLWGRKRNCFFCLVCWALPAILASFEARWAAPALWSLQYLMSRCFRSK